MADLPDFSLSNWCLQNETEARLLRSLVLGGYDLEVIEAGLVYFLDQWEEAVVWRQQAFQAGGSSQGAEFRYYLYCRSELDWAIRQVGVADRKKLSARLSRADRNFKKTLVTAERSFCEFPELIEHPDPHRHWWLFSRPRQLGERSRRCRSAGFGELSE